MLKQIILALLFIGVVLSVQVTREQIDGVNKALATAVQLDNQCVTSVDCTTLPTGSRACGGPSGYAVFAIRSTNSQNIRLLAQRLTKLEQQYNNDNGIISICSYLMPPNVACNANNQCVAESADSPF